MEFRKFCNLLIGGCIVISAMSCTGTKKTTTTTKANVAAQQELVAGIKGNNPDLIKNALKNGVALNTGTKEGKELFMHAVKSINDLELFKSLVNKTTDINVVVVTDRQQRRNALHFVVLNLQDQKNQEVNLDKAIYLLEKGIKIFENNWWKQNEDYGLITTVLIYGGTRFNKAAVLCTKLVEAGANVNGIAFNRSPLYAITSFVFQPGGDTLFELLITKGADVNFAYEKHTTLDKILPRLNSDNNEVKTKATKMVKLLKAKGAKTFAELEK